MLARILLLSAAVASAADLDPQITARMEALHVAGASVAVIDGGKLVWARGYGVTSARNGRPVNAETLFQAASISKHVAALIALHLVDEGKLSLDEDVNRKLRSWKVPENEFTRTGKVTLRRLLNHSAGMTIHGFPGYAAGAPVPTLVEVLDGKKPANTGAVRVDIVPGTLWRYSGGGYEVAQQLILDVSGKPFQQLAKEIVFEPLGMQHSTFEQPLPARLEPNAASGHRADGSMIEGRWHIYPELAAAGLWTTPSDLARIVIELQSRGGHVIRPETQREMLTKVLGDYGLGLGLGDMDGRKLFSHGGSNAGFQCLMTALEDGGKGYVIMTNSDRGGQFANEIGKMIVSEYHWGAAGPK
jgi:CubicO group peptidase (beta-lactamase class C family)